MNFQASIMYLILSPSKPHKNYVKNHPKTHSKIKFSIRHFYDKNALILPNKRGERKGILPSATVLVGDEERETEEGENRVREIYIKIYQFKNNKLIISHIIRLLN